MLEERDITLRMGFEKFYEEFESQLSHKKDKIPNHFKKVNIENFFENIDNNEFSNDECLSLIFGLEYC